MQNLPEQFEDFFEMLEFVPWLKTYWNESDNDCEIEKLESRLETCSSGEKKIASFFIAVWFGKEISLTWMMSGLDMEYREIIATWIRYPYFP